MPGNTPYISVCPIGCGATLEHLAITLADGALRRCRECGQWVSAASEPRYLDSMRWMDWKPSAPVFKVDTLLLPDSTQPGVFRLPWDYQRGLPRVS